MKFALVDGARREAERGRTGECPVCSDPVVARCGEIRTRHWAHRRRKTCDPWWENETEWHRAWKDCFPHEWQEVVQVAENGERHVADVKTSAGWVIEFQHSPLKPEERRSREGFYGQLIWVVDGRRRKSDRPQFMRALEDGVAVPGYPGVRQAFTPESRLLREWGTSTAHVLVDFGDAEPLSWLYSRDPRFWTVVARLPRSVFVGSLVPGRDEELREFSALKRELEALMACQNERSQAQSVPIMIPRRRHPPKFRF